MAHIYDSDEEDELSELTAIALLVKKQRKERFMLDPTLDKLAMFVNSRRGMKYHVTKIESFDWSNVATCRMKIEPVLICTTRIR